MIYKTLLIFNKDDYKRIKDIVSAVPDKFFQLKAVLSEKLNLTKEKNINIDKWIDYLVYTYIKKVSKSFLIITQVKENLAKSNQNVLGIICVGEITEQLKLAAKISPSIELKEYKFSV